MNERECIALIDRLRALPCETEWFEFKRTRCESQEIGEYLSALANAACLTSQPRGYLVFGIDNASHDVVGTGFDPYAVKGKGNQDLLPWLSAGLRPNTGLEVHVVSHPAGRVVLFEVGPANGEPVHFYGTAQIRVGSSKTLLRNHPEKARAIWTLGSDWSAEICEGASLDDLDPEAIAKAREQFVVKHPGQRDDVAAWDNRTLLNRARALRQGLVTNTALLLLGRAESAALLAPAVAKISWILKDAENHELDYEHIGPPFLLAGDRLLKQPDRHTGRRHQAHVRNPATALVPATRLRPDQTRRGRGHAHRPDSGRTVHAASDGTHRSRSRTDRAAGSGAETTEDQPGRSPPPEGRKARGGALPQRHRGQCRREGDRRGRPAHP